MKKSALVILLVIVICCIFLVGCNDISKQVANEKQLFNDVSNIDSLKNCFKSDFVYESEYICKDLEIIKRQTNADSKQDIVCCNVEMENDYFNVLSEVELTYGYYDVGGWILDDFSYRNKSIKPIEPPEHTLSKEEFFYGDKINNISVKTLDGQYTTGSDDVECLFYDLISVDWNEETPYNVRFKFFGEFEYVCVECYFDMEFNDGDWHMVDDNVYVDQIVDIHTDFSKMLGGFISENVSHADSYLHVYSINALEKTITYAYKNNYHAYGKKVDDGATTITAALNLFDLGINSRLEYSPSRDAWFDINAPGGGFENFLAYMNRYDYESIFDYYLGGINLGHGGRLSIPLPNEEDIDKNSTLQGNLSNWGLSCKNGNKTYYSDYSFGLYVDEGFGQQKIYSGKFSDLCLFNGKLFCVETQYENEEIDNTYFTFETPVLIEIDEITHQKKIYNIPSDIINVIEIKNCINDKLYFTVDAGCLYYIDTNGDIKNTSFKNENERIKWVTRKGVYLSKESGTGLALVSFDNKETQTLEAFDGYEVFVEFEYKNFLYATVFNPDSEQTKLVCYNIEDGTLCELGMVDYYLPSLIDINIYENRLFFTYLQNNEFNQKHTVSVYEASLDGTRGQLYVKKEIPHKFVAHLSARLYNLTYVLDDYLCLITFPYDRSTYKIS